MIVNWSPRSCDLTQLDNILWDYVENKICKNNPQSISELKNEIISVKKPLSYRNVIEILTEGLTSEEVQEEVIRQIPSYINLKSDTSITYKKFLKMNENYVFFVAGKSCSSKRSLVSLSNTVHPENLYEQSEFISTN